MTTNKVNNEVEEYTTCRKKWEYNVYVALDIANQIVHTIENDAQFEELAKVQLIKNGKISLLLMRRALRKAQKWEAYIAGTIDYKLMVIALVSSKLIKGYEIRPEQVGIRGIDTGPTNLRKEVLKTYPEHVKPLCFTSKEEYRVLKKLVEDMRDLLEDKNSDNLEIKCNPKETKMVFTKKKRALTEVFGVVITDKSDDLLMEMIREAHKEIEGLTDLQDASTKVAGIITDIEKGIGEIIRELSNYK